MLLVHRSRRAARAVRTVSPGGELFVASVVFAMLLAAFGGWDPLSYAMVAFWGFAFGAVPIALQTWMTGVAPDHLESVGGVFVATFQVSIMLGSIGGGLLLDHAGAASPLLLAAAATGLGALLFWRRGPKVRRAA